MKDVTRFFRNLAVFIALPAVMCLSIESRLAELPNDYSLKRKYFEKVIDQVEVLFIGNSHPLNGINPAFISRKSFNLASASESITLTHQLIDKYIDRMPKLRMVVLEIATFSMGYVMMGAPEDDRNDYYCYYYGIQGERDGWNFLNPKCHSLLFLYGPAKVREWYDKDFKVDLIERRPDETGWSPGRHFPGTMSPGGVTLHAQEYEGLSVDELVPRNLSLLRSLSAEFAGRGVKLVFITMPVAPIFAAAINQQRWNANRAQLEQLASELKIHYYNFLTDPRFSNQDFGTPDHLGASAAERFTKILDLEVIGPEFAGHAS